ncbi:hypothetical protein [Pseudogracilibacillus sp. SO10305]|uniref:hypothetical protein n=1 Tax=Pseudogracilibacillus sp. SO10305 TaxID=3098292 RepID=UPI00300E3DF0
MKISNVTFKIDIPLDEDGFFSMQCPYCNNRFKINGQYFKTLDKDEVFCPICGLANKVSTFYTKETIDLSMSIAKNYAEEIIYNAFKGFNSKRRTKGIIKTKGFKKPSPIVESLYENDDTLIMAHKECCNVKLKVTVLDKWLTPYCIKCGGYEHER